MGREIERGGERGRARERERERERKRARERLCEAYTNNEAVCVAVRCRQHI